MILFLIRYPIMTWLAWLRFGIVFVVWSCCWSLFFPFFLLDLCFFLPVSIVLRPWWATVSGRPDIHRPQLRPSWRINNSSASMAAASVQWNSDDINENVYVCKKKGTKERTNKTNREREREKKEPGTESACVCVCSGEPMRSRRMGPRRSSLS